MHDSCCVLFLILYMFRKLLNYPKKRVFFERGEILKAPIFNSSNSSAFVRPDRSSIDKQELQDRNNHGNRIMVAEDRFFAEKMEGCWVFSFPKIEHCLSKGAFNHHVNFCRKFSNLILLKSGFQFGLIRLLNTNSKIAWLIQFLCQCSTLFHFHTTRGLTIACVVLTHTQTIFKV